MANAIASFHIFFLLSKLQKFSENHSDKNGTNRWVTEELGDKQLLLCLRLLSSLSANVIETISGVDEAEFCFRAVRKQTPAVISKELVFTQQCYFSIRCRAFPLFPTLRCGARGFFAVFWPSPLSILLWHVVTWQLSTSPALCLHRHTSSAL